MTDSERAAAKAENRAAMPIVTEFVDACREEFGEIVVTFASENGREVGQRG
jgi:hypothetical protein